MTFSSIKYHAAILLLGILLNLPIIAQKKKVQQLTPNKLRYTILYLEDLLSAKKNLHAEHIFITSKDLQAMGVSKARLQRIQPIMNSKLLHFRKKLQNYNHLAHRFIHRIQCIEIKDIEYFKFMQSKEILAAKGVSLYYKQYNQDLTKSKRVLIQIPAILLINGRWKISEVTSIKILKNKRKIIPTYTKKK